MRVSLNLTDFSWATTPREIVARLTKVAQAVDKAGLDTLWVGDHLLQADPRAAPDGPMLEGYTTLGHLAAITARVRLGTMVTAVSYRPAALLIKAVTTLDVLSGGRAWLGIGAGYHTEASMMGLPLPPAGEPNAFVERCADIGALGIDHVVALTDGPFDDHDLTCLTTAAHALA